MKQSDIAKQVGISPKWLSRILRGNGTPSYLIAKTLSQITSSPLNIWLEGQSDTMLAYVDDYLSVNTSSPPPKRPLRRVRIHTMKMLAAAAGISNTFLSKILSGKAHPSWSTATRLASATGSNPTWWMEGKMDFIWPVIEQYLYGDYNENE